MFKDQSTHIKAKELFDKYKKFSMLMTELVYFECATSISNKVSQKDASHFLKVNREYEKYILSPSQKEKTIDLFLKQTKKRTSFVDCSNVVIAKEFGLKILSFDKFYDKFGLLVK